MGFFSWKTNNSDRSIANRYSDRSTFKVYMRDNKGNVWVEEDYEGYGRFGGKDYYELLAEMNGLGSDRNKGLWLQYDSKGINIIYPALFEAFEGADPQWKDYRGVAPEDCEYQGYFYDDDDEEDYY